MVDPISVGLGLLPTIYRILEKLYDPGLKEKRKKKMAYELIETSLKSFIVRWKDFTVWTPKTGIYTKGKEIAQIHKDLFLDIAAKTDSIVNKGMITWLMSISGNLNRILDFAETMGANRVQAFMQEGNEVQKYCEKALEDLKKCK